MAELVLYGYRESGHSYKVALCLTLLGLTYEYRSVDLALPPSQRQRDFIAVSRFGEVPVLMSDGEALVQSNAILCKLASATGKLMGASARERDRVNEWLFWEANRIGMSLPNLRFLKAFTEDCDPTVVDWFDGRTRSDLDRLETEFKNSNGRRFLAGEAVTIADIACCGYLFWPEQAGLNLAFWPHVEAWLERLKALPGWQGPYELMKSGASDD